ncbi:MAG TPA: HipA domain-containing protein, partial [Bordetella sp.]
MVASIGDQAVGELRDQGGLWSFQYTPAWLNSPHRYALSPHLPLRAEPLLDGASVRPVQWYFDNLLPEEGRRTLLASNAKLDAADAFGLLTDYGAESAGSLTLMPPDEQEAPAGGLRPLPDAALSLRIQQLPRISLAQGAAKRMSLAGAQHKLAVILQDDVLSEPQGSRPSTHILKPEHAGPDYPHSVVNEWFIMRLADRVGLDVPGVQRRYVPEPVYLIERFDRVSREGQVRRLHAIDAC